MMYENNELYHYGVKGMKWGVIRTLRGHGGPGKYGGSSKRRSSKYKKDLDILDKGGHLSVGLTKKRQAAYDARDRAALNKKIYKADAKSKKAAQKAMKKIEKQQYKDFVKKRSKEILAGESAMARIYDRATNAHVYQAQLEYGLNKRD